MPLQRPLRLRALLWLLLLWLPLVWLLPRPVHAAVWQWSVTIQSASASPAQPGAQAPPRAFLWIPPQCRRVRAVIVAQQSQQEAALLGHPTLREACRKLDFAEICIAPPLDPVFHFELGAGAHFDAMLAALADESGYSELRDSAIVPLGSGATTDFPWNFAAANPDRTLCALSVSGAWPYSRAPGAPPWGRRTLSLVPSLVSLGQYENLLERIPEGLKQRGQNPFVPLSLLPEPDAGGRDVSDAKAEYLALYLTKAARYRLPPPGSSRLLPIDPTVRGFLVDRPRPDGEPRSAPNTAGLYTGNATEAFWYFDEELANATEKVMTRADGHQVALLGLARSEASGAVQNLAPLGPGQDGIAHLPFLPTGDGILLGVAPVFLAQVPAGPAADWTRSPSGAALPVGAPIGHPDGGGPITIQPLGGPVRQITDTTFAVRFDGLNPAPTRSVAANPLWLQAEQPGDQEYRRAVLPIRVDLPAPTYDTSALNFASPPDQLAGATGLRLKATAANGQPIHFYVASGPGEMEDDVLTFTELPARARLPLRITVVAWQWPRLAGQPVAKPEERSFYLSDMLPVPAGRLPADNARAALWEETRRRAAAMATLAAHEPAPLPPETPVVPQNHAG